MTNDELREYLSDFRARLPIDGDRLEEECRNQPLLYQEIGEVAAEARSDTKSAKAHVDFVQARLKGEMRLNPGSFGLDKVTDKSVEAAVQAHEETQEAIRDYIEASKVADSLSILQEAAHQRRALLKNLTELWVTNYFNSEGFEARRSRARVGMDEIVSHRNKDRREDVLEDEVVED